MPPFRRTLAIIASIVGLVVVFIGGIYGIWAYSHYRAEQQAAQEALAYAMQLGYRSQDLIAEQKECSDIFDTQCYWSLFFQTTHSIAEMEPLLARLPCTNVSGSLIGGHSFTNHFLSDDGRMFANGQDLFTNDEAFPQPQAFQWLCPREGKGLATVSVFETATTTTRYTFGDQVITGNIARVSVDIE